MQVNPITIIIDKGSKKDGVLPLIVISNVPDISGSATSVVVIERIIPEIPVTIIDIIIAHEMFFQSIFIPFLPFS